MPRSFNEYTEQFFWDFKRMDNVNYNFKILEKLYGLKKQQTHGILLNKPIIITMVSIIECILYDFIVRIKSHVWDKIPNLEPDTIYHIKNKYCEDVFERMVAQIRKENLLRAPLGHNQIYDYLDHLRKIRNRIHIQNAKRELYPDESNVFTDRNLRIAEKMFERVCEILCNVYPRGGKAPIPMADFPRPWE